MNFFNIFPYWSRLSPTLLKSTCFLINYEPDVVRYFDDTFVIPHGKFPGQFS